MKHPTATIYNQDCIAGLAEHVPDNSVHLTVTSIPFEELFTYSGKLEDVGNNGSTVNPLVGRFALNMRFVAAQLFRVTAPGCNVCIHIQQLLAYKNQHGFIGRRDFRGAMVDVFGAAGFEWIGEATQPGSVFTVTPEDVFNIMEQAGGENCDRQVLTSMLARRLGIRGPSEFAIVKNPQAMAQRLNLHSLMFITGKRNSCMLAPAINDYVLIFTKPGEPEHPVKALYDKDINPDGWVSSEDWIRDAHGIWTDIQEIDILDGHRSARESDEEKHVCPLQLQVIYRLVRLYTNPIRLQPDVTVLDPFMGIGSTAYMCLGGQCTDGHLHGEHRRNVLGFELKESYYEQCLRNIEKAKRRFRQLERSETPLFT